MRLHITNPCNEFLRIKALGARAVTVDLEPCDEVVVARCFGNGRAEVLNADIERHEQIGAGARDMIGSKDAARVTVRVLCQWSWGESNNRLAVRKRSSVAPP